MPQIEISRNRGHPASTSAVNRVDARILITASASAIGVSFSADGTDCEETIQPFTQFTFYILVYQYVDAAIDGISGAQVLEVMTDSTAEASTPPPRPAVPSASSGPRLDPRAAVSQNPHVPAQVTLTYTALSPAHGGEPHD